MENGPSNGQQPESRESPRPKKGSPVLIIMGIVIGLLALALVFMATLLMKPAPEVLAVPEIALELVSGPMLEENGKYRFEVSAKVSGNPAPDVTFNRDDSIGEAGKNRAWIILNPGENFTLMAIASNEKGKDTASLELEGLALAELDPEPESKPDPESTPDPPPPPSVNNKPVITAINFDPVKIYTGWTYTVTADCSDPDGDPLTFEWSATGGSITGGTANPMTWKVPDTKGNYTITVTVSDGHGGTATRSQEVTAGTFITLPLPDPKLTSVTLEPKSKGCVTSVGKVNHFAINPGDESDDDAVQGFITYDLSSIPDSATIKSARLEIGHYFISGDPFGKLGALRVYDHKYGTLDAGDYKRGLVVGTIVSFANEAALKNTAEQELNSRGITAIQNALAGNQFQIRFQFATETNNDGVADRFGDFTTVWLVINYTP